ncbi:MAG TPA: hypothetical protein VKV80_11190 [Streptosporangiaceae bacterium]|nr:hypothetical protein [Streptosporangiaceae bacterium]
MIGEADVRRVLLDLHRAEEDLNAALAGLRDADLTAAVRDELAGIGTEVLRRARLLADTLSAGRADPGPGESLIRALDRENSALRRAVRQVMLAMDAGEITDLEAAHLIADAVDFYRRNLRVLMQAFRADGDPGAAGPAGKD